MHTERTSQYVSILTHLHVHPPFIPPQLTLKLSGFCLPICQHWAAGFHPALLKLPTGKYSGLIVHLTLCSASEYTDCAMSLSDCLSFPTRLQPCCSCSQVSLAADRVLARVPALCALVFRQGPQESIWEHKFVHLSTSMSKSLCVSVSYCATQQVKCVDCAGEALHCSALSITVQHLPRLGRSPSAVEQCCGSPRKICPGERH